MLKAGDIVDYRGSLYIVEYQLDGWLQMALVRDTNLSIAFDNYNDFCEDLLLVVGETMVPVKPNLVFSKMMLKHGLV